MEGHASSMFSMSVSKETKGLVGSRYLGTSPNSLLPNCSRYTLHLQTNNKCMQVGGGARMCGSCVCTWASVEVIPTLIYKCGALQI
jgi:hypothetical protein